MRSYVIAFVLPLLSVASVIARPQQALPPLSYVCPMSQDADVVEESRAIVRNVACASSRFG